MARCHSHVFHTFRDSQCWGPLISQDIEADRPIRVDVWVVNLRRKADLGRLERIVGREGDGKEKDAACVRGVTLDIEMRVEP